MVGLKSFFFKCLFQGLTHSIFLQKISHPSAIVATCLTPAQSMLFCHVKDQNPQASVTHVSVIISALQSCINSTSLSSVIIKKGMICSHDGEREMDGCLTLPTNNSTEQHCSGELKLSLCDQSIYSTWKPGPTKAFRGLIFPFNRQTVAYRDSSPECHHFFSLQVVVGPGSVYNYRQQVIITLLKQPQTLQHRYRSPPGVVLRRVHFGTQFS